MTVAAVVDGVLADAPPTTDARATIVALQRVRASVSDPADADALLAQLRLLHAVGRRDLPLGRLFEGHVDALQIVARYGSPELARNLAEDGAALGVWNADLPGEAIRLHDGQLDGTKGFASGAGVLSHALVTADKPEGRQLVLVDLARTPPDIDRSWWHPIGMRRSETHIVRWHDAPQGGCTAIGAPGDYAREPWFSGGALRFVAVHAGGVAALFDHVRDHLRATGRAADPHQAGRLATLYDSADLAAAAVRGVASRWFGERDAVRLPLVAAARGQVAELADRAMTIAQQAVGVQGMLAGHPLSAVLTDLTVYLRQPAPDAQRMRVGQAAADGLLVPAL